MSCQLKFEQLAVFLSARGAVSRRASQSTLTGARDRASHMSGGSDFITNWKNFSAQAANESSDFGGGGGGGGGGGLLGGLGGGSQSGSQSAMESLTYANISAAASATGAELLNFGKELSRDATSVGVAVSTSAASAASQVSHALQHLSRERVISFFAFSFTSWLMFNLSLFVGLPTLALAPAKFALTFSVGSFSSMMALASLRGYLAQIEHMLAPARLPFSSAYVGSLLATLYSALYLHSYSLTVLTSAAQLCALVYYQVSYFPMGLEGLKIVCKAGLVIAKPLVYQCGRALGIVKQKSYLPL